ncbi:4300_t:CDS:2, partial [Gigaspora margarita]
MDTSKYTQIKDFLERAQYLLQFNSCQRKQLEAQSKFFIVYNHLLYKRDQENDIDKNMVD